MATRSRIGKRLPDGTIKSIYCHWDGYPKHNGKILKEHYTDEAKIDALLELGDLSVLGPEIGEYQNFDNRDSHNPGWCLAYGRDRGETNVEADIHKHIDDMCRESYHYVYEDGKWMCYGASCQETYEL